MSDQNWYARIAAGTALPAEAARALQSDGFAVLSGPVAQGGLQQLAEAYDKAMIEADPADVSHGSTTIRVHDFVNRSPEFDGLYIHAPLLEACCHTIARPFKLSTMHARTLRPGAAAQPLHVDYAREPDGWPMVGFIFMIDDFREDNGATCFVRGSHVLAGTSDEEVVASRLVQACGPAGSVVVYNGSVWHGHGANSCGEPRRSIQGAYIRRDAKSGIDLPSRMQPETLKRIGVLARYVLAVEWDG